MSNLHPHFQEIIDLFIKPLASQPSCAQCGANFGAVFSNCYEHNAHSFHRVNDAQALRLQVNAEGKA